MKKLLLSACCLFTFAAQAQLTITDSLTVGSIATLLEGLNVSVSNVTVNCAGQAMGHFAGTSELSITEGLVLTTGHADYVANMNMTTGASGINSTPGDADLEADLGGGMPTHDACALEFDCVPYGDTLLFNFSFGSEEYPEFVGSSFNDAFAIYLTGPGFLTPTNVAAIPGGTLVSINNVNSLTNSGYFYDNEFPPGQYVEYDGFTTNLTAFAVVQPGETYHFKVVVADVADGIYDSGVFLEAFSFRSPMLTTSTTETPAELIRLLPHGDEMLLQLPNEAADGQQVLVIDAAGRVAQQLSVTGSTAVLNTEALGQGLYVVKVTDSPLAPARFVKN